MLAHPFRLQLGRTRAAPYWLRSDALELEVNPAAGRNFPAVAIEAHPAFLWTAGAPAAGVGDADTLIERLAGFERTSFPRFGPICKPGPR